MRCDNCIHFFYDTYGDGWNEPRETEYGCKYEDSENEEISEMVIKAIEQPEIENKCTLYNGGICEICETKIGKHDVFWVSGMYGDWRCCSNKCVEEASKRSEQEYDNYKESNLF